MKPYIHAALDAILGQPFSCALRKGFEVQTTGELGNSMFAFMTGCSGSSIYVLPSYLRWVQMYHNVPDL